MMHLAFVIESSDTTPSIGFYQFRSEDFILPDLTYPRLAQISGIRYPVAIAGNAENANATILLDNGDGMLIDLFNPPPLARGANIYAIIDNEQTTLFTGTVVSISIGSMVRLSIEA